MRNGRGQTPESDDGQVAQEIERISGLDLASVRSLWRATFKKEPPGALTRDLLVRQLAWHIQEKAFGGHDAATLRLLDAYGRQNADKVVLFRRLKPGTSVVREYQGVRHIVTIGEGGFVWQGKAYGRLRSRRSSARRTKGERSARMR